MSIFEHARWRIYNSSQHPYKHDVTDLSYVNPRIPGIYLLSDAIDYIVSVLYPDYKGTVANAAALPVAGNNPNDYIIVSDDGSGYAAGYVWSTVDNVGQWIKRYDMAWSMDSILAETINRTEYMYAQKYGVDDKDASGTTIAGIYAGQRIFGGATSGNNLTLSANSGNANSSTHSGFIQADDNLRPTIDNTFSSGSATYRWSSVYAVIANHGTLTATSGSITDSSGAISFGSANLSTTGSFSAATASVTTSATINNLNFSAGSITSTSGALSFGSNSLTTTGTITGATGSKLADITLATGSITSVSATISFGSNNLSTSGTLAAGASTLSSAIAGNLGLTGNTLYSTNTNGNITISPNGLGSVSVSSAVAVTGNYTSTSGNITLTNGNLNVQNIQISGNTISSTNLNGVITLTPNGAGLIAFSAGIYPVTTASQDSGKTGNLWNYLWLSGGIKNATQTMAMTDLMALRNASFRDTGRTQAAQTGDALFYDATSGTWLASVPDTEITHSTLSGLVTGDAGHTQFAMLAGRAGGQTVQGGTAASENLILGSTSNVTKGYVKLLDSIVPNTNAAYTTSWAGTDLGNVNFYFRDHYSKGQMFGLRLENVTSATLPTAAASSVGRLVYTTDTNKIYVDNGTSFQVAGVGKFLQDQTFDGSTTTYNVTITGIQDARNAIWQLCDNTNNFERVYCQLQATSATNIRIISSPALPAGSYRLIGLE